MYYGADLADRYQRIANYVDRIRKGGQARRLSIEQTTKFELVINLKTANGIGDPPKRAGKSGQSDQMRASAMKAVLLLISFILASIYSAEAQQSKKVPRIGYLSTLEPARESTRSETIRLALRELGYIEGQNIASEYRYGEGKPDRYPELAAELVRLKVDIIVVSGGTGVIRAAKNATHTIPIIMSGDPGDPVKSGLVESLARPAGTLRVLQAFHESRAASGWSCSKKPFLNLLVSLFSTIRPSRRV
jgi:ABC-type uncharacterized transport system substrate-binding protein